MATLALALLMEAKFFEQPSSEFVQIVQQFRYYDLVGSGDTCQDNHCAGSTSCGFSE